MSSDITGPTGRLHIDDGGSGDALTSCGDPPALTGRTAEQAAHDIPRSIRASRIPAGAGSR